MPTALHDFEPAPSAMDLKRPIAPHDDTELLAAGLLEELLNSALLAATAASIATWRADHHSISLGRILHTYIPPHPVLYSQLLIQILTSPQLSESAPELRDYYDRLAFLRALEESKANGSLHELPLDERPDSLAWAWQKLATVGKAAIEAVSRHASAAALARQEGKIKAICEVLDAAAAGRSPCIDVNGHVAVPFWTERRVSRQTRFDLHVYLLVNGGIQRVAVLDASAQGLGVSGLKNVAVGDAVDLVLQSDHSHLIAGRVIWESGDRAGIALDEPIPQETSRLLMLLN